MRRSGRVHSATRSHVLCTCRHNPIQYNTTEYKTPHVTLRYVLLHECVHSTDRHAYIQYLPRKATEGLVAGILQGGSSVRQLRPHFSHCTTRRAWSAHGSWSGAILTAFEAFSDLAMLNQPCVVQCGEHVGQKARSRIINSFSSLLHSRSVAAWSSSLRHYDDAPHRRTAGIGTPGRPT